MPLLDLVRAAAAGDVGTAIITPERSWSYEECRHRCEAVAHGLVQRGITRLGSAVRSPADSIMVAVAASAVGCEACLYPRDLGLDEPARFAQRFDHEVVVVDRPAGPGTVTLDELGGTLATTPLPRPQRWPVLILTTGTTGEPKGARYDWARLVRSVHQLDAGIGTRWLLTYNLNQFAGLQILLHVLASRGTLVVPASRAPEDVVDAVRAHAVTHVSATPTFWRLLVGRLDAREAGELPLEQITLGGEATPAGLIERLRSLFPQARISHVYAGTEFGSAISVRDGRSGLPLSVLDRDETANVQFRIVDDELQIRSGVGMLGYHRDPDALPDWRPTGDLVQVQDDRIHFIGRTTEIINVGGAKVHPLPVEELLCAVEGVQLAAVYGRSNAITGQIVAADVVAKPGVDTDQLEGRLREACEALPRTGRPRRIRFVPELETRGNKLLRREVLAS